MTYVPDPEPCGCEHEAHFRLQGRHIPNLEAARRAAREPVPHGYLARPAGDRNAMYVGPVCDECANGHMAPYIR